MSLIRFILLFLIGYFFYKGVKAIIALMSSKSNPNQTMNTNYSRTSSTKSKIDKKDIIDADFEEIDDKKE